MQKSLLRSFFLKKKKLIQNILFMQTNLLQYIFKTVYLCKGAYYDLFLKKQLI